MSDPDLTRDERSRIALEAYFYLYPLVLMDVTRRVSTNWALDERPGVGPMGTLQHARAFPSASFRTVVRPNFDTLYSSAWVDVGREPYLIELPAIEDRFFMLPIYDMWTDVVASPGTRTHGARAATFALCSPDWRGILPEGVERIDVTTPVVWLIGRTETRGAHDVALVHGLQDRMRLAPLSSWPDEAHELGASDESLDGRTPPVRQVDQMGGAEFFTRGLRLGGVHRPHATDWNVTTRMARAGLAIGSDLDPSRLEVDLLEVLEATPARSRRILAERAHTIAANINGWSTIDDLGVYANAYVKRALIARGGLGANPVEESLYPNLSLDAHGEALHGSRRYALRFAPGAYPPADAFWSLTVYDRDGFPVANEIERHALGSRDELEVDVDGSLEILLAHERPADRALANWLPVPEGDFVVTLRLYLPREEVLLGRWRAPGARRLD